ncbi:MAG: phospholipase D-like domain-containing protein [Deltaproteobacteria bacterium]|nr:phospholipase D-like domain-containing protein [Deltaproteobacteria bacterium]
MVLRKNMRWLTLGALLAVGVVVGAFYTFRPSTDERYRFQIRTPIPGADSDIRSAIYQSLGTRMLPGHTVTWLNNGQVFDAVEQSVRAAKTSIHMLLYIWEEGAASNRITDAVIGRAKEGVECRILVDAFGSSAFGKTVQPQLTAAGCDVRIFRPLAGGAKLSRNHRKIVVVDGVTAVTGGFGIRDSWLGDGVNNDGWRDANVLFSGPAVTEAQQAFAENWQEAGGALLPEGAFPPLANSGGAEACFVASTNSTTVTRAERLTQLLIAAAKRRLWISNAYVVPSSAILQMLKQKASEGVDVRLLAPGKKSDSKTSFGLQHTQYGSLLKHGVRIWEYQPSMLHSKTMLVDERIVVVGSINLDPLSLNKLEEGALVVSDEIFAGQLARAFQTDCTHSRELTK